MSFSSSWSNGDGYFFIEAVVFADSDRQVLYRSSALTSELHEAERDRVCRALRSLNRLGPLSLQALALEPDGILEALKRQFENYLSEEE
jgi:hypothetical protein